MSKVKRWVDDNLGLKVHGATITLMNINPDLLERRVTVALQALAVDGKQTCEVRFDPNTNQWIIITDAKTWATDSFKTMKAITRNYDVDYGVTLPTAHPALGTSHPYTRVIRYNPTGLDGTGGQEVFNIDGDIIGSHSHTDAAEKHVDWYISTQLRDCNPMRIDAWLSDPTIGNKWAEKRQHDYNLNDCAELPKVSELLTQLNAEVALNNGQFVLTNHEGFLYARVLTINEMVMVIKHLAFKSGVSPKARGI